MKKPLALSTRAATAVAAVALVLGIAAHVLPVAAASNPETPTPELQRVAAHALLQAFTSRPNLASSRGYAAAKAPAESSKVGEEKADADKPSKPSITVSDARLALLVSLLVCLLACVLACLCAC